MSDTKKCSLLGNQAREMMINTPSPSKKASGEQSKKDSVFADTSLYR